MSRLEVADLVKAYGRRTVLEGIDLDVEPGSLTAVLGLSGCGKTTLLRVIAGFERAQRGRVALGGRTLEDEHTFLAPEHRGIGYVPQEGALFPHLDVEANVGFGLPRGERRGRAVAEMLEMVGISTLARRHPQRLSGGEQQRVALARALVRRPQALLLDEPFSSLDASLRSHVRDEVQALLRAQGVTTVLVTHDQEEAMSLADAVAVLRDGRIVQQGTPAELYERPADEDLARFLGAVNLLPASFDADVAITALGPLTLRAGQHAPGADASGSGTVIVRPEQLHVSARADGGSEAGGWGVAGRVEQCRYYGHDALLQIRPDGAGMEADVLVARVSGQHALPAGTSVNVAAHGPVTALAPR